MKSHLPLLIFCVLVLNIFLLKAETIYAQTTDPAQVTATGMKAGELVVSDVPQTESAIMGQIKDFALDLVAKMVAGGLLEISSKEVLGWATRGNNGNPFTNQNFTNSMQQIKNNEFVLMYKDLQNGIDTSTQQLFSAPVYDSNNPSLGIGMAAIQSELTPYKQKIQPTISPNEKADFLQDFNKGGWSSYTTMSKIRNNPTGSAILTMETLGKRITTSQNKKTQELNWGSGMESAISCGANIMSDPETGFEYCTNEAIKTGGKMLGEQISSAVGTGQKQKEQASVVGDIGSIASTMLSGILNNLIYQGLNAIGNEIPTETTSPYATLEALIASDPNFSTTTGAFNMREVVDLRKELNSAIELTQQEIDEYLQPTNDLISKDIFRLTMALDHCIPGPDIGFQDRLRKYFRTQLNARGLEQDARDTDPDEDDVAFYSNINIAFAQYMANVSNILLTNNIIGVAPYYGSVMEWLDLVTEISRHGETLSNITREMRQKSRTVIQLANIVQMVQTKESQITNTAEGGNIVLFNSTWDGLTNTQKHDRFKGVLKKSMITALTWEELPISEQGRIINMFQGLVPLTKNETSDTYIVPTITGYTSEQLFERIALYELFNIPIIIETGSQENPYTINNPEILDPNAITINPGDSEETIEQKQRLDNQKRDFVMEHGWKLWDEYMNQTSTLQKEKTLIVRSLTQARNSYSSEKTIDIARNRKESVEAAAKKLRDAIQGCYMARYEIINADEVIPNKRTLILPEKNLIWEPPEEFDDEPTITASVLYNERPTLVELYTTPDKMRYVEGVLYVPIGYKKATDVWVEYSNDPGVFSTSTPGPKNNSAIIGTLNPNEGIAIVELAGDFNSATWDSNNSTWIEGSEDLTINLNQLTSGINFRVCASNNMGPECNTTIYTTTGGNVEYNIPTPLNTPEISNVQYDLPNGYNYFSVQGVAAQGMTVLEPEFDISDPENPKIRGIVSNHANNPRVLLRMGSGAAGEACSGALFVLSAIFSGGASAAGCGAIQSTVQDLAGIPIIPPRKYQGGEPWVFSRKRPVALSVPIYKVDEFIQLAVQSGTPAQHNTWSESSYVTPTNPSGIESNAYAPITNPVVVLRNWHVDTKTNMQSVWEDYFYRFACELKGFGPHSGNGWGIIYGPNGNYTSPSCSPTDSSPTHYSQWYKAQALDYQKEIYPLIKQFAF